MATVAKRGILFLPAASLAAACFAACGIDTLAYLSQNPRAISSSSNAIDFRGPLTPDPEYLGMDILYKIYAVESDADTDKASIQTKQEAAVIPGDIVKSYILNSLKYRRLSLSSAGEYSPCIKASLILTPDDELKLSLGDVPAQDIEFTVALGSPVKTYRNTSDGFPLFSVEPSVADADYMAASGADPDASQYYVQAYAVSYGVEFVNFTELYGDAVYLGRIILDF